MAMKKILVTGGSGFLGSHLLPLLLQENAKVSCLVRSLASAQKLPAGVAPVYGDCLDAQAVARAVQGQDSVIHLSGLLFGADWRDYLQINGQMAQNLALAAGQNDTLEKFIFVSSLAAAGPCSPPGRTEDMPTQPVSAYGWSKYLAEQVIGAVLGRKAVILRPPIIYGPGDRGLLPLFRACGRGIGISRPFSVSVIYATDCARAIIQIMQKNAHNVYHLSDGQIYSMDDFCQAMARAQGRDKLYPLHLPKPLMAVSAAITQAGYAALAAALRRLNSEIPAPPQWNLDKYREAMQCGWVADATRLESEGFKAQVPLDEGMASTVDFYRHEGML